MQGRPFRGDNRNDADVVGVAAAVLVNGFVVRRDATTPEWSTRWWQISLQIRERDSRAVQS